MTIAHTIKQLALGAGIELRRHNAAASPNARASHQLWYHEIDLVLDVGANDGGYCRMLREPGFGGETISFEPLSDVHAALTLGTANDDRWHVAPRMALGAEEGEIEINVAGNSTSSSILPMGALHQAAAPTSIYQRKEPVALRRLDGFAHPALGRSKSVLLKIDTQGYEMAVLRGAAGCLANLRGVQVEPSVVALYEGQATYREVIDFLEGAGFALWNAAPGFVDPRSGRMLQFDGTFFRTQDPA